VEVETALDITYKIIPDCQLPSSMVSGWPLKFDDKQWVAMFTSMAYKVIGYSLYLLIYIVFYTYSYI
jgi:hypothetical protein